MVFAHLKFSQRDNPIERAEFTHQQRSLKKRRRFPRAACFVLLVISAVSLAYLRLNDAYNLPYGRATMEQLTIQTIFSTANGLLLLTVFVLHLLAIAQALNLTASAVPREKELHTWESLILTHADARRIVRGKWWAALRTVWRQYGYTLLFRAGALVLLWLTQTFRPNVSPVTYVLSLLLAVLAMLVDTVVNIAFAGALGMLASTLNSRATITITIARAFHLSTIFSMVGVVFYGLSNMFYMSGSQLVTYNILVGSGLSALDGGLILASTIMSSNNLTLDYLAWAFVLLMAVALAFVGLIWAVLRLAEYLLTRQNALRVGSH